MLFCLFISIHSIPIVLWTLSISWVMRGVTMLVGRNYTGWLLFFSFSLVLLPGNSSVPKYTCLGSDWFFDDLRAWISVIFLLHGQSNTDPSWFYLLWLGGRDLMRFQREPSSGNLFRNWSTGKINVQSFCVFHFIVLVKSWLVFHQLFVIFWGGGTLFRVLVKHNNIKWYITFLLLALVSLLMNMN